MSKSNKFKELEPVPDLPKLEKQVIDYWEQINPLQYLKDNKQNKQEKVYYDGPITANGMPHYGHGITWSMKDVVPRHWTMSGYYVSRNMGWDCQGLPVEVEVEKKLGFENKEDIEKYGVAKFNKLCKESVTEHIKDMYLYETRLGRWFDEEDMYYTMDTNFIESMWWAMSELYKKGLLYQGHSVVAYSTRAGTTLSSHEVADGGYKELEDPAVTLKFQLKSSPDTYVLAWTTTPWTLPGNLMLGVGKKIKYVKVKVNDEFYILAKSRLQDVFEDTKYEVVQDLSAKTLEGQEYIPLFNYYEHKRSEGCFKIIYFDYATDEEGTGIVHLAPYGAEDFDAFMSLGISIFDYLDDTAHFTSDISDYEGLFYKDANPKIMEDLSKRNLLFKQSTIIHRMPICWRTKTPLIYKPMESWYLKVSELKSKMLAENQNINWIPEHIKSGMSYQWISNARDWSLSRNRYWGTPMPIWENDETKERVVIGSFDELEKLSGVKVTDPHKPYVDEITWVGENGGTFKRIPDVVDVWFDSGAVPFAKLHYPFENKERFKQTYPAEYISESTDQVRLWFYTMHVLGVALFDQVPYKNVVVSGMLNDSKGKKLSKSLKNYEPLEKVLDEYGGDSLRYFLLNSTIVQAESPRYDNKALVEGRKKFFIPLWNCVRYFTTYANVHNFEPEQSYKSSNNMLDQWIIARLKQTSQIMTQSLNEYQVLSASRQLEPFVTDLSTWYIRRSRDRLRDGDKEALNTLFYVLSSFVRLTSPFVPFLAETLYESLNLRSINKLDSVHFDTYESLEEPSDFELDLIDNMQATRDVVSLALSLRSDNGIKIRQPLAEVFVGFTDKKHNLFEELIMDEVNVKKISLHAGSKNLPNLQQFGLNVSLDTSLTPQLQTEGNAREMVRTLQDLRKKQKLSVSDSVKVTYKDTPENQNSIKEYGSYIKEKVSATELIAGENFMVEKI